MREVHTNLDQLATLDIGVAARLAGFLIPAGADVSVSGHEPILPFFARGAQSSTVCIFATGEIRAFLAVFLPGTDPLLEAAPGPSFSAKWGRTPHFVSRTLRGVWEKLVLPCCDSCRRRGSGWSVEAPFPGERGQSLAEEARLGLL